MNTLKKEFDEEEVLNKIGDTLKGIKNPELLILKGHLLIEYFINKCIDSFSEHNSQVEDIRFTFMQKLEICKMFGLINLKDEFDMKILEQLIIFNRIRNKIAHTLTFDRSMLNDLFTYHPYELEEHKRYKEENKNLSIVKGLIPYYFGALSRMVERKMNKPIMTAEEIFKELGKLE